LKAETAAFRKDAEDLRHRNVEIRIELDRMDPEVAELHRDTAKLEISVNETRVAIAERNAEASSGLLTALVVVVVCVVATYAIAAAASAASSAAAGSTTVTATPVQGGGAMINLSRTFTTW
jgi:predicted phage tail protein